MRLLLVEDQGKVARFIHRGLEEEGYAVDVVPNGEDALAMVDVTHYDLVVLDLMLPGIDGLEVCRRLRRQRCSAHILMLTAKDSVDYRVTGLDVGADDYLAKPFAFAELLARLRALLRRHEEIRAEELVVGDLRLNPATHEVVRGDRRIDLTRKEYQVLEYLMRRAGQVVTRTMILEGVWDYDFDPGSNVVDVYIRYLRRKLDDPFPAKLLETIRGTGYRLRRSHVS